MENQKQLSPKTGYLNTDFRLFYLTTREGREFQSHYHDFHKLLVFFQGNVSYVIEGETYQLQPRDIVLVPAGEVHHPIIHTPAPYERLISYLSPGFFSLCMQEGADLYQCFRQCIQNRSHVIRLNPSESAPVFSLLSGLSQEVLENGFASLLYQRSLFLQFLILLNRSLLAQAPVFLSASSHPLVQKALSYINSHLQHPLSVDEIASFCYVNRSYLMHLFRKETGSTLGSYIAEKRLFYARSLIRSGVPVTEACLLSGFPSYSSFYRAYKKKFGNPPKDSRNLHLSVR